MPVFNQWATTIVNGNKVFTITDQEGNSVAITRINTIGGGYTLTFVSSGGLHQDGQIGLQVLINLLTTGLDP